jgi:hypothetical protein
VRGLRLLAALTLLAGAGGACTSSATSYSSPAVSTASPSSTPVRDRSAAADGPASAPQPASPGGAQPASVPVDLALTGALSGHVASARAVAQCGVGQVGFAAQLELVVNGRPYLLGFQIVDFHGPGDYPVPPIRASLRPVSPGSSGGLLPAVAGHVSIAANQRSGRLQLTLGTSSDTRLQGTWAC